MAGINGASNGIQFNRGIDFVSRRAEEDDGVLPDSAPVVPGDAPISRRLDEVLYQPSVDESILDQLRPVVSDRNILAPGRYGRLSEETEVQLREHIEQTPTDPDNPKFERLARLLEDERGLRDLLDQYRHVLHKG
jgi:hypothetical protein